MILSEIDNNKKKDFRGIKKRCLHCGAIFKLNNSRDICRKKFCSRSCSAKYYAKKDILLRLFFNYKSFWDLNNGITLCKECHQKMHPDINLFKKKVHYTIHSKSQSEHIHKCMSDSQMVKEFPDNKQRLAVCNSLWDNTDNLSNKLEKL